jgi:hypothetical protein
VPVAAEKLGHLGDTQLAARNPADARVAWEEALAILDDLRYPDADQIRAKLTALGPALRDLPIDGRLRWRDVERPARWRMDP